MLSEVEILQLFYETECQNDVFNGAWVEMTITVMVV